MSVRRLSLLAAVLGLLLAVSGCATQSYDTNRQSAQERHEGHLVGHEVADDEDDGTYVSAGPITYQLEISRQLNPYSEQDKQYFVGLPKGQSADGLNSQQLWYGVFLWAKNQHHRAYTTSDNFEIVDTLGNVYKPLKIDSRVNPLAWTRRRLGYGQTEPGEDSVAAQYFENGKLVLFKLNDTIYANRPLTLYILSPTGHHIGQISLDL